jgi:hypothetical protein
LCSDVTIDVGAGLGINVFSDDVALNIVALNPPELVYWDGAGFINFATRFEASPTSLNAQSQIDIINIRDFTATTKSFDITHPTKGDPWRLRYGVLEGPEHGVYFRGHASKKIIELPDYWTELVHSDSITVQLTPIGNCMHYVVEIKNNKIFIDSSCGDINCYYLIHAERKDVEKVLLEYVKDTNQ